MRSGSSGLDRATNAEARYRQYIREGISVPVSGMMNSSPVYFNKPPALVGGQSDVNGMVLEAVATKPSTCCASFAGTTNGAQLAGWAVRPPATKRAHLERRTDKNLSRI